MLVLNMLGASGLMSAATGEFDSSSEPKVLPRTSLLDILKGALYTILHNKGAAAAATANLCDLIIDPTLH